MYIYIYIHSLYKSVPRNSLPSGELFAMGVKERASGIVTSFNFAMGFFVTLSFQSTQVREKTFPSEKLKN